MPLTKRSFSAVASAAFLSLTALSAAQSGFNTSAQAYVGATNGIASLHLLDFNSGSTSASASADQDFTGLDGSGQERTMNFSATTRASSEFGRLRTYASGVLSNTYYNSSNPDYSNDEDGYNPDGSPDQFGAAAFAGFVDTLQYGGLAASGYKAQYIFGVHGIFDGSRLITSLYCSIAGNDAEELSLASFSLGGQPALQGEVFRTFATHKYAVNGQTPQKVDVLLTTQFNPFTVGLPDGSTVEGTGDFSGTVELVGIALYDPAGNRVQDFTITSGSGTTYPKAAAVPEPASLTALGLGAVVLIRRRRG